MSIIRYDDFHRDMRTNCFDFFYWYSRFEFSLKENGFVREGPYKAAIPDWEQFRYEYAETYICSKEAKAILAAPPQRQIFDNGGYRWERTSLKREKSELGKVILILKSIRNNLFHGGKGSQQDWDNPKRNLFLLKNGKVVLDDLSKLGNLWNDYARYY